MVKLITLAVLEESWKVCTFLSKGSPLFLKDEVICPKILTPSWLSCMLPPAIFLLVLFNSSRSCGSWGPRWGCGGQDPSGHGASVPRRAPLPGHRVWPYLAFSSAPTLIAVALPLLSSRVISSRWKSGAGIMGVVGCAGERSWRCGFWS